MKKQGLIRIHICFIALIILMLGCKKNKDSNCGCNGKIVFTIKDSDEQTGYLMKRSDVIDDPNNQNTLPYSKYGIVFIEPGCSNCIHSFFICNDSFLSALGDVPTYPGIQVKFSGKVTELCSPVFAPADYSYNHIILTKIQKL